MSSSFVDFFTSFFRPWRRPFGHPNDALFVFVFEAGLVQFVVIIPCNGINGCDVDAIGTSRSFRRAAHAGGITA